MLMALQGAQMLFVAFGALVLVPLLTGMDPNVALFGAGLGTLLFQLTTKRSVPVFLASSFAFIAPIIYASSTWGLPATLGGLMAAGFMYLLLGLFVRQKGADMVHRILPPVVVGPIIMVIGLALAPVAVNMAMGKTGDGSAQLVPANIAITVSMLSLLATLAVTMFARGVMRLVPIISGILVGYLLSLMFGIVDFSAIEKAAWLGLPNFVFPEFNLNAIIFMLPIAIAPAVEHIGDMLAISNVTGKDYLKKPGLHRTLSGDGIATMAASLFGAPPNTTYSEVTGAVTLMKTFNPLIMTWAAVCAIVLSLIGKVGAFLQTIPVPVMGGIMILLFGSIAGVGMNTLVRHKVDLSQARNLIIFAVTLVFGIGGMVIDFGGYTLQGVSLCSIVAILLNLVLPKQRH